MLNSLKPAISRAMALLGLLGLGLAQAGCAHPVAIEPSVSVHSHIGHFPVYAQVGVPGAVLYAPPPRVIYAPAPRPRVVHIPHGHAPLDGWGHGHGHGRHFKGHDRPHGRHEGGGHWRGGGGHRDEWRR